MPPPPALLLAALFAAAPLAGDPEPAPGGIPVARVSVVGPGVERNEGGSGWRKAEEEFRLRTGESVRTGPASLARLEFPWMAVTLGPASTFSIPPGVVLALVLEQGRLEIRAEGGDIIKLRTTEAEIRGGGHVVIRRENGATMLSALDGRFRVEAAGKTIAVAPGEGLVVEPEAVPVPVKLPEPPALVAPGADPVYVKEGQQVELKWRPEDATGHVQVLALGADEILIDRDVAGSPLPLAIPWLGTFRWRVAGRDERGLESPPSADGYVCVVEK